MNLRPLPSFPWEMFVRLEELCAGARGNQDPNFQWIKCQIDLLNTDTNRQKRIGPSEDQDLYEEDKRGSNESQNKTTRGNNIYLRAGKRNAPYLMFPSYLKYLMNARRRQMPDVAADSHEI